MMYLIVFALASVTIGVTDCEEVYKTKFDNIDIESIMKNERLLKNHFTCLLEGKACTPETDELRKYLPEIMETCCGKCSEKHKESAKKMTLYLIENKPEMLKILMSKYDPDRKYVEKCGEQLKAGGVDISKI